MLGQGDSRSSRSNMLLGIAAAVLSIIGLGANVYKHNTGVEVEWFSVVSELAVLAAAMYFVISYFRNRKEEKKEE